MTSRKDLPRCKTCKHWGKLAWSKGGNYGECHLFEWTDWAVPKSFGCVHHSDLPAAGITQIRTNRKPKTQTETNDDSTGND